LERHFADAPVAFAVTEGPMHVLRYANSAFRRLHSGGEISIGEPASAAAFTTTDLTPLLDRAFSGVETICDELLAPIGGRGTARWRCTVWPMVGTTDAHRGLVMEVRDAATVETARTDQRAIAERLLLSALREQDAAQQASEVSRRAVFLASTSHDLARSLDEDATREIVQRCALVREGTWCIVDLFESSGAIHRLAVVHPDPAKQALAHTFANHWYYPRAEDAVNVASVARATASEAVLITRESGGALLTAAHGAQELATLRELGFGALLLVPLVVRAHAIGAITFVVPEGGTPLSPDEIALASDLASCCAMALDNARLYHEAAMRQASAEAANRAKSAFLSKMGHELRTPLNAIGGYAEVMDMGIRGPVTPEQRHDLSRIKHNQGHLLTLLSEIFNYVQPEGGRREYHFAEVPVHAVLSDVAETLDADVKARKLSLVLRRGDVSAVVWADLDRVRQILLNLVSNAIKYSRAGHGFITLDSTVAADVVMIHVIDAGPGIATTDLESIFQPFVQLESGAVSRHGGVGLGLAISRDLARAMRGELTVASTVGVGSRFTLTLPRVPRDLAVR